MDKMTSQFGEGNLYYQTGFSNIYAGYTMTERECRLAKEKGLRIGIIFGNQTHTQPGLIPLWDQDIRCYQWRLDGKSWYFSAGLNTGDVILPGELRDSAVYSPSRLCTPVRTKLMTQINTDAKDVLKIMSMYPGVISILNGIIEEELAMGGQKDNNYLADYSPYAITEFRDWLRHTGIYDDVSGTNKGEGAPAAIIGNLISINGVSRSQFYDDPTPDNANGTGQSFNAKFGTAFTTWSLMYYDLTAFPNPIVAPKVKTDFNPTPLSGYGFIAGGFDAPRVVNAANSYWNAWSWDVLDHAGAYPTGNPTNPAFGFRQQMVKNYIKDVFKAYADAGLPTDKMYPHQIPDEEVGVGRSRSGASPVWTGFLELSNNVGITKPGGKTTPSNSTQYSQSWGIFEWHPLAFSKSFDQALYTAANTDLNNYYQNNCHALFPGWWSADTINKIFPLNDSRFGVAIKQFLSLRKEQPYTRKDLAIPTFTPPKVLNVEVISTSSTTDIVRWQPEIWNEYPETWRMWSQLDNFEVQQSTDNINWIVATSTYSLSSVFDNRIAGTSYYYRVRASSKAGLKGHGPT